MPVFPTGKRERTGARGLESLSTGIEKDRNRGCRKLSGEEKRAQHRNWPVALWSPPRPLESWPSEIQWQQLAPQQPNASHINSWVGSPPLGCVLTVLHWTTPRCAIRSFSPISFHTWWKILSTTSKVLLPDALNGTVLSEDEFVLPLPPSCKEPWTLWWSQFQYVKQSGSFALCLLLKEMLE